MKNNALKIIVFCLITLSSLNSIAQTPGTEDGSGITGNLESTTSDAPISDYIIPMLVIGVLLSFSLLRKNNQFVK
jgi:hypothetical protein